MTLFQVSLLVLVGGVGLIIAASLACLAGAVTELVLVARARKTVVTACVHLHVHRDGTAEVEEPEPWRKDSIFDDDEDPGGGPATFIQPIGPR